MHTNGIVIQEYVDISYKGIDGSGFSDHTGKNWYFNDDEQLSSRFEPFYDEQINLTYYNLEPHSWVAVCNDWNYIHDYIAESKRRGMKYRVLLCETEIPNPVMEFPQMDKVFLGYDYAYACGDNYSAVYNEIPYVFPQFHLNQYGLFDTEQEIRNYISVREKYEKEHPPYTLEYGDFVIFKLHEILQSDI